MADQFSRSAMLLGRAGIAKLQKARVLLFGVGGVGGQAAEALCRAGVGAFTLVDNDTVSLTNLNRQVVALHSTLGQYKVEVMAARMRDINPAVQVQPCRCFYTAANADAFAFSQYSYVVDCIDTVSSKLLIAQQAQAAGVPCISAMGAGNKLDPSAFCVADIYDTSGDPLARVLRRELRKRGVRALRVVYSEETAMAPVEDGGEAPAQGRRTTPGSLSFVPGAAGLVLAGAVVRDLAGV